MSDTPRTDAATMPGYEYNYIPISFAEGLEVELAEVSKDAKRLEWLIARNEAEFRFRGTLYPDIDRDSIDAAMKEGEG